MTIIMQATQQNVHFVVQIKIRFFCIFIIIIFFIFVAEYANILQENEGSHSLLITSQN